jgi:pimeloyl-ACP methyl ester carboxylesterase
MGGWSWRDVLPRLRDRGHVVHAPTLTGLGDRVHLMSTTVTAHTHAQDVENLLYFEDLHDVVLVGHSYAGIVITLAAERSSGRIKHLVYLDAMVPIAGRPRTETMDPEAADWIRSQRQGEVWTHPPMAMNLRAPNGGDTSWFVERLVPQPAMDIETPVHLGREWEAIRRTYVACTESPIHLSADAIVASPGWERIEMQSDHFPMLSDPESLAEVLDGLA